MLSGSLEGLEIRHGIFGGREGGRGKMFGRGIFFGGEGLEALGISWVLIFVRIRSSLKLLVLSQSLRQYRPCKVALQTLHLRSLTLYCQMVQELFNWSQAIRENWLRLL